MQRIALALCITLLLAPAAFAKQAQTVAAPGRATGRQADARRDDPGASATLDHARSRPADAAAARSARRGPAARHAACGRPDRISSSP